MKNKSIAILADITHWLFFILMISSVFWLEWYYILLVFMLLRIQDLVLGGCILTYFQYGTFKRQWVFYDFIQKSKLPKSFFTFLFDWFLPGLLIFVAWLIQ